MYATLQSGCLNGLEISLVQVEIDLQNGLPSFCIVGLPDPAVRESRDRVRSALKNAPFEFPMKRITVNLAPAHLKKEGSSFELAIALGLIMAKQEWESVQFKNFLFLGELSLKGELQPVKGVLPLVMEAKRRGFTTVCLPSQNAVEASAVSGMTVYAIRSLSEIVQFLKKEIDLKPTLFEMKDERSEYGLSDFSDVRGQKWAKKAFEIAAAGGHHILTVGPPGCGKSLLAKRLPTILPLLSFEESLEITRIYSVGGYLKSGGLVRKRPFRSPHHTISYSAMAGGGHRMLVPGEVSLSHHGILFLDELSEFRKEVLEVLREPLEERKISISRVTGRYIYPANFLLVAAMNPCPCGYYKDLKKECQCSEVDVRRYRFKVSGPLLDRIDIHVSLSQLSVNDLLAAKDEESSAEILERVMTARKIEKERYQNTPFQTNSDLSLKAIEAFCHLKPEAEKILNQAMERFGLSLRSRHRILKISRTIADLSEEKEIRSSDIAQALQLRFLDR